MSPDLNYVSCLTVKVNQMNVTVVGLSLRDQNVLNNNQMNLGKKLHVFSKLPSQFLVDESIVFLTLSSVRVKRCCWQVG